jgi:tetratricopeptide (TPR) repeat protein
MALQFLNRALDIRRDLGDPSDQAATLTNIGNVDYALGLKLEAIKDYENALSIQHAIGERDGEAGALNNLGDFYESVGEKQEALNYFKQALPLAVAVKDPIEEARIFCNLDGIAESGSPSCTEWLIVEAKANHPEFSSPPSGAGVKSRELIRKSLRLTQSYLGVHPAFCWHGTYYQYANRLAFLYFLNVVANIPARHPLRVAARWSRTSGTSGDEADDTLCTPSKGQIALEKRAK